MLKYVQEGIYSPGFKKLLLPAFAFFLFFIPAGFAQWTEMVADSFHGVGPVRYDLSTKLLWGGQTQPVSALLPDTFVTDNSGLGYYAGGITPQARSFASFTNPIGLKTNIAIDYPFPHAIDRNLDSIRISADFLWETLLGIGESGRFVMALLHSYPAGGPVFGSVDSVNSPHPFGRPAYNIRVMNKDGVLNQNLNAVMMYGGGNSRLGDFEIFRNATSKWWLPGFITEPGGTSPGSTGVYPTGGSAQIRNTLIASKTNWRRYTWTIFKDRMKLEVRNTSDPESTNMKALEMFVPKADTLNPAAGISAINGFYNSSLNQLPRLYYWFPQVEALRFFWNAGSNVWIANLRVETTGHTPFVSRIPKNQNPENEIRVYPNPGNRFVQISGLAEGDWVEVINSMGQRVAFFPEKRGEDRFDTGSFRSGLYFFRIRQAQSSRVLPWVKE